MPVIDEICAFHDQLTEWRRDIHAHPELGFEEQRTSDLVAQRLAEFGYEVFRGIGKTGVVGRLRADSSSRCEERAGRSKTLPQSTRPRSINRSPCLTARLT